MAVTSPPWRIRGGRLLTPAPFLVAGIVNLTPDSFSDGGSYAAFAPAMERIRTLLSEGADIVDLGAESTRPGAEDIGDHEEWRRLEPVLAETLRLRQQPAVTPAVPSHSPADRSAGAGLPEPGPAIPACPAPPAFSLSLDTFRAGTAALALSGFGGTGGADIINDVSGGGFDPAMDEVLVSFKPGYVLGHSLDRPATMQREPRYDNVVDTLLDWFGRRMSALVKAGLPEECIALDPCIGFGKTLDHTLAIVAAVSRFRELGRPLYFGISRKSFLGALTGQAVAGRDTATQVATALLARAGVAVHRVHQVADTVATLKIVQAFDRYDPSGRKARA